MKVNPHIAMAVVAAGALAFFVYRGFKRDVSVSVQPPAAASCAPEAIRQMTDALERSIRAAQCAQQATPTSGSGTAGG